MQKLDGKIYDISNAYRYIGSVCGNLHRSAEAEMLSLPNRTYSLSVMAEIGYLKHEEKRSIPEICYFLISLDIEISERECYDLVHAFEELIATRDANLDQDFIESARKNGGIVMAIDGVRPERGNSVLYVIQVP